MKHIFCCCNHFRRALSFLTRISRSRRKCFVCSFVQCAKRPADKMKVTLTERIKKKICHKSINSCLRKEILQTIKDIQESRCSMQIGAKYHRNEFAKKKIKRHRFFQGPGISDFCGPTVQKMRQNGATSEIKKGSRFFLFKLGVDSHSIYK